MIKLCILLCILICIAICILLLNNNFRCETFNKDNDLVIITGADKNYFIKLKKMIGSIQYYDNILIYVYDFGLTTKQIEIIKTFKNVIYKFLDLTKYPEWISHRVNNGDRGGTAMLMIPVVYELANEIPNDIIWLDAGNQIGSNLNKIRNIIKNTGYYTTCIDYDYHMKDYTHQGMLDYLNVSDYKEKGVGHIAGGAIGIAGGIESDIYKLVIKPAYDCFLDKNCMEPGDASLANHRYDASIYSILFYKNNLVHVCGESSMCPSYSNCQEVTICNSGCGPKCPDSMEDHDKFTIQFTRGGGPEFELKIN